MLRAVLTVLALLLCSCALGSRAAALLDYEEFGPPSMANELLGMDWWQWQAHGDPRPRSYGIKVFVYRNLSLDEAKRLCPVVPEQLKDCRHVAYAQAVSYLDRHIAEDALAPLTARLKDTRAKIVQRLGPP